MIGLLVTIIIVLVVAALLIWGLQQMPGSIPPMIRWAIIMLVILILCVFLLRFLPLGGARLGFATFATFTPVQVRVGAAHGSTKVDREPRAFRVFWAENEEILNRSTGSGA